MIDTTKSTSEKILVENDLDIVAARLRVREVAREMGFRTVDQARISLAAGELARVLAQNIGSQGLIVISAVNTPLQMGIQVTSVVLNRHKMASGSANSDARNEIDHRLNKAIGLVDEGSMEDQGEQGTRVTLMKWLS